MHERAPGPPRQAEHEVVGRQDPLPVVAHVDVVDPEHGQGFMVGPLEVGEGGEVTRAHEHVAVERHAGALPVRAGARGQVAHWPAAVRDRFVLHLPPHRDLVTLPGEVLRHPRGSDLRPSDAGLEAPRTPRLERSSDPEHDLHVLLPLSKKDRAPAGGARRSRRRGSRTGGASRTSPSASRSGGRRQT